MKPSRNRNRRQMPRLPPFPLRHDLCPSIRAAVALAVAGAGVAERTTWSPAGVSVFVGATGQGHRGHHPLARRGHVDETALAGARVVHYCAGPTADYAERNTDQG